jgi:hypothetical protein
MQLPPFLLILHRYLDYSIKKAEFQWEKDEKTFFQKRDKKHFARGKQKLRHICPLIT